MALEGNYNMKITVSSDSTCDLSRELIDRFNISVIPMSVIKGGEVFKDGVDISPTDIFRWVDAGGDMCSTIAPPPSEYEEHFSRFLENSDCVIHVSLGSGFSASHQNARIAAEQYENVYVVDSRNLSTGQGHVVLEAARMVQEGMEPKDITAALEELTGRVETSFVINNLHYLVKGGRCSAAAAFGANLLKLKPCIELTDGKMSTGKKYRGSAANCISEYVKDRLKDRTDIIYDRIFITHTEHTPEEVQAAKDAVAQYSNFKEVCETIAGCTVSCHCGPKCLGVLFIRKKKE